MLKKELYIYIYIYIYINTYEEKEWNRLGDRYILLRKRIIYIYIYI